MKKFEQVTKLIDLSIKRGDLKTARKMALNDLDRFVELSEELLGFKETYNNILDITKSGKSRYVTETEIRRGML